MALSGTTSFTLDVVELLEEAYERIGINMRGGYEYRTARRTLDLLLLEWQNRGLNLWGVEDTTESLVAGQSAYPLTAEKLDVVEAVLRTNAGDAVNQTDLHMERISVSAYARQTNKLKQGRPLQYWVERTISAITVNVWPVPDTNDYTLAYYYIRRLEDSGSPGSNDIDVPARHLPALAAGVAYHLAMKRPEAAQMLPILKEEYESQWELAADATREKANLHLVPGGYR